MRVGFLLFLVFMQNQNPVDSGALTRAQQAKQGPRVIAESHANRPASETDSPLLPIPIEVEYRGHTYTGVFDYEAVSDILKRKYDFRIGLKANALKKHLPAGVELTDGVNIMDYAESIPEEKLLEMLEVFSGMPFRDDLIAMYVPHLLEWDVTGPDGEIAPFSVEAFTNSGGGIYNAFLEKMREVFTESKPKPTEPSETSAPAS